VWRISDHDHRLVSTWRQTDRYNVFVMRGLAAIACVALAACYAPSAHEGAPCAPGGECPTGLVCDRGLCLLTARPDDAAIVADATADAPVDAYGPCSGGALLSDALDDTSASPLFEATAGTGITVTEGSDQLEIVFAATVTAPAYGYYSSKISYTTAGLCVRAEVSDIANVNAITFFKLSFGTTEVEFFASNGTLELRTKDNNAPLSHKSFTANLVDHRYWRLRFAGGTTYWDTSADDTTYTEQVAVAGAFPATSGYISFGAGAATDVTSGDKAVFESIKATGP
jgi:hypothetical protein